VLLIHIWGRLKVAWDKTPFGLLCVCSLAWVSCSVLVVGRALEDDADQPCYDCGSQLGPCTAGFITSRLLGMPGR
jgi:hypothetical protein